MTVVYRVTAAEFPQILGKNLAKVAEAIDRAAYRAAQKLVAEVIREIDKTKPYPPVDRGEMRQSVDAERTANGAVVYASAPHAIYMELGTRPHFPPVEPIKEWVIRKRIGDRQDADAIAFAIARSISENGIEPRLFMKRALSSAKRIFGQELKAELRRVD